jgi:hypothetical protein
MSLFHHHADGWNEFEDVDRPTWMDERFKAVIKYPITSHSIRRWGYFHLYVSLFQDVTRMRFIQKTVLLNLVHYSVTLVSHCKVGRI